MSRERKDPTEYALTAFNSLRANQYRWNKTLISDAERSISRLFYDQVFSSGAERSGFSTVLKNEWKMQPMADDHYMAPQSVTKFIMDKSEILLDDYDYFEDVFMMCRKTHYIKKEQNEMLKDLTKKTCILTRDRYKHLGFNLYKGGKPNYIMEKPELEVPTYFTDWEMGYQTNGFRAVVVDNKVGTLEDFFA
tara:strand:+ start:259 stop:834 length:576 start_codon:yes stop_codon:yes gene_type:complete